MNSRIINKFFCRFESVFSRSRFRLLKTLYINFRTLKFKEAIKLPIFIYGKVSFFNLGGTIEIKAPVKTGMIKLGCIQGYFTGQHGSALILLSQGSKLIFNGPCKFDLDYAIRITGNGIVNIGKCIGFGSETKIYCEEKITIGDYCRIPFGSTFMDTNYHYSIDTVEGIVHKKSAPIHIGSFNWIGNTSTIMKGTRTPNGAIIASKSFLNRDYIKLGNGEQNIVIAGSPAKIVRNNMTRVLSLETEELLNGYFKQNPDAENYADISLLEQYKKLDKYNRLFA